jgi:phosphate transport system permease protein
MQSVVATGADVGGSSKRSLVRKPRLVEGALELMVKLVALTAIASILLILVFVGKEALPLFTSAEVHREVTPASLFAATAAGHIWQPVAEHPKYDILPLLAGSLKVTLISLVLAVPLSVGAAIFVAEYAPRRARELLKPAIELLAGVPSVVIGFFALVVLAGWVQRVFGTATRLNALVAGIGLSFAICPIVFTIAEDALRAVPGSYRTAATALGSTPSQTLVRVILPAAVPGIAAAIVLGFGRAVGETMIVLLASGNAALFDANVGHSTRTITATIAAELGEVVVGSPHYHVLFALGALLFIATFGVNFIGERIVAGMRRRLTGTS